MSSNTSETLLPVSGSTELPPDEAAQPREHFIPLRKTELVKVLAADETLSADERQHFLELSKLIGSTIHFHYHQKLEELKEAYWSVDPDVDERSREGQSAEQISTESTVVFEKFGELMERANFRKLTEDEIH